MLIISVVKMSADILDWATLNIFVMLGFGVAFTVLMPGEAAMSSFEFAKPIYKSLRALLGDFDLDTPQGRDALKNVARACRDTSRVPPVVAANVDPDGAENDALRAAVATARDAARARSTRRLSLIHI